MHWAVRDAGTADRKAVAGEENELQMCPANGVVAVLHSVSPEEGADHSYRGWYRLLQPAKAPGHGQIGNTSQVPVATRTHR